MNITLAELIIFFTATIILWILFPLIGRKFGNLLGNYLYGNRRFYKFYNRIRKYH